MDPVRARAIRLLQERSAVLGRLPLKSDFTADEVGRIKAALGPWPRALEQAGLKAAPPTARKPQKHPRKTRSSGQKDIPAGPSPIS